MATAVSPGYRSSRQMDEEIGIMDIPRAAPRDTPGAAPS